MKLNAYTDRVELNTIGNARYNVDHKDEVYARTQMPSLTSEVVKVIGGVLEHEEKKLNEQNSLALMNAQTDYQNRMQDILYNKENGLMYTKEGGAAGAVEIYAKASKQAMEEIKQNLPRFEYVHQAFQDFVMQTDGKNNTTVSKHENAEYQAYRQTSFKAFVNSTSDMIALSKDPKDIEQGLRNLREQAHIVFGNYGDVKANELGKEAVTEVIKASAKQALDDKDPERANQLLQLGAKYGMSAEETLKLTTKVNEETDKFNITQMAKMVMTEKDPIKRRQRAMELAKQYGGNAPKSGPPNALWAAMAKHNGKSYELGAKEKGPTSDCGLYIQSSVNEAGGNIKSRAIDEMGWQAQQEGRVVDIKDIQPGDIVHWATGNERWAYTDDPNKMDGEHAYLGMDHGGIVLPDGTVSQMGSNGVQAIPLNTYKVVMVTRPKYHDSDEGVTMIKQQELADQILKAVEEEESKVKKAFNLYEDDTYTKMKNIANYDAQNNVPASETYKKLAPFVGDDLMGGKCGDLLTKYKGWADKGVSGDGSGASATNKVAVEQIKHNILGGQPDNEVIELAEAYNLNPKDTMDVLNELDKRSKGKGIYGVPFKAALNSLVKEGFIKKNEAAEYSVEIAQCMVREYNKYKEKNHDEPTPAEVKEMLKSIVVTQNIPLRKNATKGWLGFENGVQWLPNESHMNLQRHGVAIEYVADTEGRPYVRIYYKGVHDGDYYVDDAKARIETLKGLQRIDD